MARRSQCRKASRNSTPARRHAGCGQAASTSKDQLPGAVETIPGPGDRGSGSEQRVRLAGNGTVSSATDGRRIATTSGYYRSIYSTVTGDATRCSSSVEADSWQACSAKVGQIRGSWAIFHSTDTELRRAPAGAAAAEVDADIRPRIFAGTQFSSCRARFSASEHSQRLVERSTGYPELPTRPRASAMSIRNQCGC